MFRRFPPRTHAGTLYSSTTNLLRLKNQSPLKELKSRKSVWLPLPSVYFIFIIDKYSTVGLGTGGNPVSSNIPKERFTPPVPKVTLLYKRHQLFLKDLFKSLSSEDFMTEGIYRLKSTTLEQEIKLSGKFRVKNQVFFILLDYHHYLPIFFDGLRE